MPASRKVSRRCVCVLAMSVAVTILILPTEIFEYNSYLRHITSKSTEKPHLEFNWSLPQVKQIPKHDDKKKILDKNEETTEEQPTEIKKVIILAYMRSGSSLTGKLLEQSDHSIYFFEPLRPLEWSYSKKMPLIDFNNKTRVVSKAKYGELRIKLFEDVFSCNFRITYKDILFDRAKTSDDRFKPFYKCVGKKLHKVDECLHIIQDICDRSLVRIAKVIRLRADQVLNILERLPDLKVIHLLRDPRAIISSLLQMRMHFKIEGKAKSLCNLMKDNTIAFEETFKLCPNQTITLFFESLAKNPIEMTKKLFDFIGVATTEHVFNWVNTNMHGEHFHLGTYSVGKGDSLTVSNKWRKQMKFKDVATIDTICKDFYNISGYMKVRNLKEMNDRNIVHFLDDSKLIRSNLEHTSEEVTHK